MFHIHSITARAFSSWRVLLTVVQPRWSISRGRLAHRTATHTPLAMASLLALEDEIFDFRRTPAGTFTATCQAYPSFSRTEPQVLDAVAGLYEDIRAWVFDESDRRSESMKPTERAAQEHAARQLGERMQMRDLADEAGYPPDFELPLPPAHLL